MNLNNNWSCLPVSICVATGIDLRTLLEAIGHDGSGTPYPAPYDDVRAGFHMQECIDALLDLRWAVTPIQYEPKMFPSPGAPTREVFLDGPERFKRHLYYGDGVICGRLLDGTGHTVASMFGEVFDPNGNKRMAYNLLLKGFEPDVFYKMVQV